AVAFALLPLGIAPQAHKALAVGLFMIAAWMTQVLDLGLSGILGCFLFWMLGIAKFETAFSGFADTSAWFLFGAVCFGLMVGKSGLARRLAFAVMRVVGHTYPRLLLGLIISNFLLTPVVPSDIIVMIVAWRLALWMYPPEAATLPGGADYLQREIRAMGSWSRDEVRAALLMSLAIGLWVTDFLHHIPAPMIGLVVGLLAVMPRVGVLDTEDLRKINYLPIFFVAAAVSLSNVLAESKAL